MKIALFAAVLVVAVGGVVETHAQEAGLVIRRPETAPSSQPTAPSSRPVVAKSIVIDGKAYKYTVKADFLTIKDETGKAQAKFFHTAYMLQTDAPAAQRPITFVFNGGPGSSSVWLHMGAVGPKKVDIGADALPTSVPAKVVDNPSTWLPETDLVFIDPIGTGFSKPEAGVDGRTFWSVEGDVSSIGEFIRLYLAKNNRWASPKFLAGESYGTTRAAGLSNYLSRRLGIDLNGIVLISSVLEFSTIRDTEGNDLPSMLFLPSYTAVAWHHKKLSAELQAKSLEDVVKDAEAFALGDYFKALAAGGSLQGEQRTAIAKRLAELTGLPVDYVVRSDLKIAPSRFMKALLADKRLLIGRYDGTITGFDPDGAADRPEYDPSYSAYQGAYTSAFNAYLHSELDSDVEDRYEILNGLPWTYPQGSFVNVAGQLADAMVQNPHLHLMVASGYQDLATPFFATQYTLDRLNVSTEGRQKIKSLHYFGGHMLYHYPQSLKQLGDDARAFIRESAEQKAK